MQVQERNKREVNRKIRRFLDDEERIEGKIMELQEQLKGLRIAREEEENREIIKGIRRLKLSGRELFEVLCGLENGTITLSGQEEAGERERESSLFQKEHGEHKQAINIAGSEDKDDKKEITEMH